MLFSTFQEIYSGCCTVAAQLQYREGRRIGVRTREALVEAIGVALDGALQETHGASLLTVVTAPHGNSREFAVSLSTVPG